MNLLKRTLDDAKYFQLNSLMELLERGLRAGEIHITAIEFSLDLFLDEVGYDF